MDSEDGGAASRRHTGWAATVRASLAIHRQRISYNAAFRLLGRGAGGVLSLVALSVATHYFGASQWGHIVAAVAFVSVFSSVSDFGLQAIASREMSRRGADIRAIFQAAAFAALEISVVTCGVAAGLAAIVFVDQPETRLLVFLLLPSIPLMSIWLVTGSVFIAHSRNDSRAALDIASSALVLASAVAIAIKRLDVDSYAVLMTLCTAATAALALLLTRRYVAFGLRPSPVVARSLARTASPLGLAAGANALYGQLDTMLVALLTTPRDVALFGVAAQLAGFAVAIPGMLVVAMTPTLVRCSPDERRARLQRAFDVFAGIGALVPLLAALFGKDLLVAVSGTPFSGAAVTLALLSASAALAFPNAVVSLGLVVENRERRLLGTVLVALAVNLVGNLIAVPLAGIAGAAAAFAASEITALALNTRSFRSLSGYMVSPRNAIGAVVASGGLGLVCIVVGWATGLRTGHGPTAAGEAAAVSLAYVTLLAVTSRARVGSRRPRELAA